MKDSPSSKRTLKLLLGLSVVLILSFVGVYKYDYVIKPDCKYCLVGADPREEAYLFMIERKELNTKLEKGQISRDEYDLRQRSLDDEERDYIAPLLPSSKSEYDYQQEESLKAEKANEKKLEEQSHRPPEFWFSLVALVVTGGSTLSGSILAWRSDRRLAIETSLKVRQLEQQLESQSTSKIIIS